MFYDTESDPMMTTQRMRSRKLQEEAERQTRLLALMLIIEIFGFGATIIIELMKGGV